MLEKCVLFLPLKMSCCLLQSLCPFYVLIHEKHLNLTSDVTNDRKFKLYSSMMNNIRHTYRQVNPVRAND